MIFKPPILLKDISFNVLSFIGKRLKNIESNKLVVQHICLFTDYTYVEFKKKYWDLMTYYYNIIILTMCVKRYMWKMV